MCQGTGWSSTSGLTSCGTVTRMKQRENAYTEIIQQKQNKARGDRKTETHQELTVFGTQLLNKCWING